MSHLLINYIFIVAGKLDGAFLFLYMADGDSFTFAGAIKISAALFVRGLINSQ